MKMKMKKILHDITDNERLEEEQYRRQMLSAHGFSSIDIQERIFKRSQEDKKECEQSMAAWKKRKEMDAGCRKSKSRGGSE